MSLLATMREARSAKKAELDGILSAVEAESRTTLTDEESTRFDTLVAELRTQDARITELEQLEAREAEAAKVRAQASGGQSTEERASGGAIVTEKPIYAKGNPATSYFRDLYRAKNGDADAADRLRRNVAIEVEKRALSTTAGAGGEFAPPEWIISDFVSLARPGRKLADSIGAEPLPSGVSSINLPKVSGGTSTAIQASQNSALSQTDMTTTSVSSGISTIGGKQVVARQLLDQSGIPFDEVILKDLAADYAKQLDTQVISGSGASGQLEGVYTYFNASGTVNVTFTSASPAVASSTAANSLYNQVFAAASQIATHRYVDADTIWMHPRRWAWILASVDSNSRPLVVPNGTGFNVVAVENGVIVQGYAGTFGGFPVITDPNIPTNLGAGTNQDPILIGVRGDLRLWESDLRMETFDATYADSAGVLFRVMAYSAAIPSRYTTSVSVINGTGLVAPTGF